MNAARINTLVASVAPWSTLAACLVLAVTDFAGSALTPGYSAFHETTSQLTRADAPYATSVRVGIAAYGILLLPFAVHGSLPSRARQRWSFVTSGGVWAHVLGALAAAAFQNESAVTLPGGLTVNAVHDLSAQVMYAAGGLAMLGKALATGHPFSSGLATLCYAGSVVIMAAGLAFILDVNPDLAGVFQRVGATLFMVWATTVAISQRRP